MPAYNTSPFASAPALMVAGWPQYLYGSYNTKVAPTKLTVSQVALTSDVATLTVLVTAGNIPAVGSLITAQGLTNTEFNVTNVALTAVSIDAATGAGTVSFDLTHANVTAVADNGFAKVPQPEVGETIVEGSSVPAVPPSNDPNTDGARTFQAVCGFPTIPTDATVTLEAAEKDQDSEYTSLGTVATVAAGVVTQSAAQFQLTTSRFLRFNVSALTGSGTLIAKLLF